MANVCSKHHSSFLYIGNRIFRFNLTETKSPFLFSSDFQKPDEWTEPMKSKQVKEAKDKKQVYIPCGAIANSMFSGELALLSFFDFKQPPSLNPYRSLCK